ncbi:hypothetical protein DFH09DRAFT_1115500 [Mycena vulgaris]|nr:hypothetical protein DFH09DRAFT_1115500 [Mycena vulgaris]
MAFIRFNLPRRMTRTEIPPEDLGIAPRDRIAHAARSGVQRPGHQCTDKTFSRNIKGYTHPPTELRDRESDTNSFQRASETPQVIHERQLLRPTTACTGVNAVFRARIKARERHGIFDRGIEGRTEIESRRSENRVPGRWTACIVHCAISAPLGRNSGLPLLACEDVGPETVCAHLKPPSQRAEAISARVWHGNPLRNPDDLSVEVGMLQMAPGNAPLDASI